jgi:DNA-binding NarL/FixJ family response regulator
MQSKDVTIATEARKGHIPTTPQPQSLDDSRIHVLLVDDHPAVRHGIRQVISDQPDMVTVAEHSSASHDTTDVSRWADVAVIDYHLGDRDGLWLTRQIKQRPEAPPVLIYSAFADTALAIAAIVAGADGMLPKATLAEELTIAIRRLAHGRQYFPAIPRSIADRVCSRLQAGDQAIFSMLIHGVAPAEIGSRLELSPGELEARRQLILRVIAPKAAGASLPGGMRSPLDYDRPRRRPRYLAAG